MWLKIIAFLLLSCRFVFAYKILVALPTTFKSHYQFGSELAKRLALEGHEVTVVSPFKQPKTLLNFTEVYLEQSIKQAEGDKTLIEVLNFISRSLK